MTVPASNAVPVTVLGGYLGSGKTTRINALLRDPRGRRIALVVNDFGSINIDAELLRKRASDLLELSNGCVCCSLVDGMAAAMHQLADLRPGPDHVLIEVSGVGDPAGVARWSTSPGFAPGGIVVCVDVETVEARAADRWVGDTVLRQLAGAEVLLLTKTDLVRPQDVARVRRWLSTVAPNTPVDAGPDALTHVLRDLVGRGGAGTQEYMPREHEDHRSWSLTTSGFVDSDRLVSCLEHLPVGVVRVKGVVRTRQHPDRRTVVQRVGQRCELQDDGRWQPGDESVLVLIAGRGSVLDEPDRELAALFGN